MAKYAVRRGHQYTGGDGASSGYLKEIDVADRYHKLVIQKLKSLGHQVLDVTPPEANRSLSDSLNYGINMANNWGADYFVSCHANAFETDVARGCEVVCGSNNGIVIGERIVNEFIKLGFPKHQGAYMDVRGLAEIKGFKGITLICEPAFIDSKLDVAIYNKVGDEGIANAIVLGLTGQEVTPIVVSPSIKFRKILKVIKQTPCIDDSGKLVKTFQVNDMLTAVNEDKNWWTLLIGNVSKANCQEAVQTPTIKPTVSPTTKVNTSETVQYGIVTASTLFVRNGHTLTSTKLGTLDKGTKVKIDKKVDNFYSIYYGDHGGFVSADYITLL